VKTQKASAGDCDGTAPLAPIFTDAELTNFIIFSIKDAVLLSPRTKAVGNSVVFNNALKYSYTSEHTYPQT
jgi:hypothetical protein